MRTNVYISFDSDNIPGGAQVVLEQAQCGTDVAEMDEMPATRRLGVKVTLEEKDPRVQLLLDLLRYHKVDWNAYHDDAYTEEELDSGRLLLMMGNGWNEIGGGVRFGTMYDLSDACPACGTGGKQTSPLFVDREDLRNLKGSRAGETYHGRHLFVDERLAEELERIGATGLTLGEMYAEFREKRMVKLPWKQLLAARTLPPMSPSTTGLSRMEDACKVCSRNGYCGTNEEPLRVVYRSSDIREVDDVNFSWENKWFADLKPDLRESLLSWPWLLVTPKVRRVITGAGVTCFDWLPIRVEDG
jgi:hypothetical protein